MVTVIIKKYYWKPAMGNLDMDLKDHGPSNLHCQIQCAAGYLLIKE